MCQFQTKKLCLPVRLSIRRAPFSRTVHHVIIICGTHMQNYDISMRLFHFLKILIFSAVGVKG